MKLFNKVEQGFLRGFGLFQYGRREVLNVTWPKREFNTLPGYGFTLKMNRYDGIFLGVNLYLFTAWIQLCGQTAPGFDDDIQY